MKLNESFRIHEGIQARSQDFSKRGVHNKKHMIFCRVSDLYQNYIAAEDSPDNYNLYAVLLNNLSLLTSLQHSFTVLCDVSS